MTMSDSRPTVSHTGFRTKVMDYISRMQVDYPELLVFDHVGSPEAGIQIPTGTVEDREFPFQAVLREALEESGLSNFSQDIFLGSHFYWYSSPKNLIQRYAYLLLSQEPRNEWVQTVAGEGEDAQMEFKIYWIPLDEALGLQSDFGTYLRKAKAIIYGKPFSHSDDRSSSSRMSGKSSWS